MEINVATTAAECTELIEEWQRLADGAGATCCCHPWWAVPWLRHHEGGQAQVIATRDQGRLVALAPLHEQRAGPVRVSRFIGHGLGAVGEILVDRDDAGGGKRGATEIVDWLTSDRWRILQLENYRMAGGGIEAVRAGYGDGAATSAGNRCPTIEVPDDVTAFLATRSKRLRKNLRRGRRRLDEEDQQYEVEVVHDSARLAEVLPEIIDVYDAAEREKPRHHLLRGRWGDFTREVLTAAADDDRLRVFLARVDGTPVSFDVGFTGHGRLELWMGRFDPSFGALSPGHLALEAILTQGESRAVGTVDLGLGDDQYKHLWTDDGYSTVDLIAAGGRWRRALAVAATERLARRHDAQADSATDSSAD